MSARSNVRSGLGGLAFGAVLYIAGDTASDLITYNKLHGQAMQLVRLDRYLIQMVGEPYTNGAWYNATLAFSHRDKVAHCTFQLQGSKGVTDISVKAGRKPGYRSNILYNTIGTGTWDVLSCQAMVPSKGGLVKARSLLPEHQQAQQQQQQQDCQPCSMVQQQQEERHQQAGQSSNALEVPQQQLQQQHQQAASAAAQRSWWQRSWWPQSWLQKQGDSDDITVADSPAHQNSRYND